MIALVLPLLALASSPALAPASAPPSLPAQDPAPVLRAVRVVDAATGVPLAGVELLGVHERLTPRWGEAWYRVRAVTDADGRAELPSSTPEAEWGLFVARAEGYAVHAEHHRQAPERVELRREVPVEVQLLDFYGRPAPLVHLGVAFGCGHTPDLVSGVSDVHGRVVLHGLEPGSEPFDLYAAGEGVLSEPLDVELYPEDGSRPVLHLRAGHTITGVVRHLDGTPAAGVFVGEPRFHRGPWAETDADGRFRVMGVEPEHGELVVSRADGQHLGYFEGHLPGVPRVCVLPEEPGGDPLWESDSADLQPLHVEVIANAHDRDAIARLRLRLWDPVTGWAHEEALDESLALDLALRPGTYHYDLVAAEGLSAWSASGTLRLTPGTSVWAMNPREDGVACDLQVRGVREGELLLLRDPGGLEHRLPFDVVRPATDDLPSIGAVRLPRWPTGEHAWFVAPAEGPGEPRPVGIESGAGGIRWGEVRR